MSRPIYEPSLQRTATRLNYGQEQLFRRPAQQDCCPVWIAAYDNEFFGQDIATTSGIVQMQFPYIDWSDNAGGIFSYVRTASTIGATNNYNPTLEVDGVYAFTFWVYLDDPTANNYSIYYSLDTSTYYPGRATGRPNITDRIVNTYDFQDAAGTARVYASPYLDYYRTIVLPCELVGGPGTVYPAIQVLKPATAANFTLTFRSRFWITYLGPLDHATTVAGSRDPYPVTP